MLKKMTLTLLSTCLLLLPVAASAHSNHCQDTQLGEQMKALKQQFKDYRQALAESNWAHMRLSREQMQQLTADAAHEQPLKMHDMPAEHHALMMQEYHQGLDQLNTMFTQLAEAEQAQDADAVETLVGQIGEHSKQSHESLRKDCE